MNLELKTLDYSIKKDEVEKYLKYGFKFSNDLKEDREYYYIDMHYKNIIDIHPMEDLLELEKTFDCGLIVYSDRIYIYNDYFE